MRYAVISDVHANPTALRAVIRDAEGQGVGSFVCLGDVVGYGPDPVGALTLVRTRCAVTVAGNHDDAVSGRGDASAFIDLAGEAVSRHRSELDEDAVAWLRSLPYEAEIDGAVLVHGDRTDPASFNYVESEDDARVNFDCSDGQLTFVGHTHVPELFLTGSSGRVYQVGPTDFTLEEGKRYIVNPGSVGYPRESDGRCLSSYVVYDSDERTVSFRYVAFSVSSVMQRGRNPKRLRRRMVALVAGLCAIGAALGVWLFAPREVAVPEDDPALVVAEKTVELSQGRETVQANLTLEAKSAPVRVRMTVTDGAGNVLTRTESEVRRSLTKKTAVPSVARRVTFRVLRHPTGEAPKIRGFDPQ